MAKTHLSLRGSKRLTTPSSTCSTKRRWLALAMAAAAGVGTLFAPGPARAATMYFTDLSGPLTWDNGTSAHDWSTTSGSGYTQLWTTGSDANFEGTAGTVNVSGTISSVNSITFATDGYTLSGGTITLTGAGGNVTTGSGSDTFGSVIAGSVGLTKLGSGTLTLTGSNTYTGTTTISAGILNIRNANALGNTTNGASVTSGAALQIQGGISTAATPLTLNGTGISSGGALLNVSGNNTYGGLITLGSNASIRDDSGTLTLAQGVTQSFPGASLTLNGVGGGAIWLNGAAGYTGTTAIQRTTGSGTLNIYLGADNALSTAGLTQLDNAVIYLNGHTQTLNAIAGSNGFGIWNGAATYGTLILNLAAGTFDPGYMAYSSGNDILMNVQLKSRTGTAASPTLLNMWGTNNRFTGTTTVTGNAALNLGMGGAGWTTAPGSYQSNNLTLDGGGLLTNGASPTIAANAGITVTSNGGYLAATSGNTLTVNSIITGTGPLNVNYNAGTVVLGATNSYTGDTTVGTQGPGYSGSTATLKLGIANALPYGAGKGNLVLNSGATLNLNGFSATINELGGSGTINNSTSTAVTLTLGSNTPGNPFTGVIQNTGSGALALVKTGTGIQILAGASTYAGGTTISAGTLIGANASALGTSSLNVAANAVFAYQPAAAGSLTLGALTLAGGAGIGTAIGGTTNQSVIASTGAATVSGNIAVNIYGIPGVTVPAGTTTNNLLTVTSGLNGGTFTLGKIYNATNFTTGALTQTDGSLTLAVTQQSAWANEYWKGGFAGANGVWAISNGSTASNWASDLAGTATSLTPGTGTTLNFSTTASANNATATTLGALMSVAGIVVNDSNGVGLNADGNTLTIGTGGLTINSGAVTLAVPTILGGAQTWTNNASSALTVSGNITNSTYLLTVAGTGNSTISSVLGAGSGGLTKSGTGTLTLTNANNYSGTTTVTGGVLQIGNAGTSGTLGTGSVTITSPGSLTFNHTDNLVIANAISGTGSFIQAGTGTVTLTNLSYTGGTSVQAGALVLANFPTYGNNGTAVAGSAAFIASGATLTVNYASGVQSAMTSLTGGGTFNLQGTGQYYPDYAGGTAQTIAMSPGALFHVVSGNAAFGYGYAAHWINNFASLTIDSGATLSLWDGVNDGNGIRFDALNGAGTINEGNNSVNTLYLGVANGSGSFSGIISDSGGASSRISLTKMGTGTQILSGSNTYTGTTTVNAGTLLLDYSTNASVLSSSSPLTLGGGILNIKGKSTGTTSQTLSGAFTLSANTGSSIVVNTNGGGGTTLTLGGTWTRGANATLFVDLSSATTAALSATGTTGLTPGTFYPWLTVKDSTAFGFGTLSGTNIVRYNSAGTIQLPASGATSGNDYALSAAVGGATQVVTTSETGNSLAISPDAAGRSLTINSGQTLGFTQGAVAFDGSQYAYTISGPGQFGANAAALTLTTNGTNALTISAPISSGAGSLTVSGSAPVILTGTSSYAGGTTIGGGGTLQFGNGLTGNDGAITGNITNNGTLAYNTYGPQTYSGVISGTGAVIENGPGTITLSGANSYTGTTSVNSGRLVFITNRPASTSAVIATGATLEFNNTGTVNTPAATSVTGTGVFQKTGGGQQLIGWTGSANSEFRVMMSAGGVIDVAAGDLNIGWVADSFNANYASLNVASGATFHDSQTGGIQVDALTGSGKINNAYNSTTPTLTIGVSGTTNNATYGVLNNTATFSGTIGYTENYGGVTPNSLNVIKTGAGTQILSGTNGYTGTTTINAGMLEFVNQGSLYNSTAASWTTGNITVASGATFAVAVGGTNQFTTGNLTTLLTNLDTSGLVGLKSGSTLGLDIGATPVTYSGVIANPSSGTLALNKLGAGTLVLSGSNTYTGATTITAGTLQIGAGSTTGALASGSTITNNSALAFNRSDSISVTNNIGGSGTLAQMGGGTLTLAGANTYAGLTTVSGGGELDLSAVSGVAIPANLTIGNGLVDTDTVKLLAANQIATASTITISSDGVLALGAYNNTVGGVSLQGGQITGSGTLTNNTIAYDLQSGTVSATLAGSVGVNKTTGGTLTLSGNNTYSGGTTLSAGKINLTGKLTTSSVTMASLTTLTGAGNNSFTGIVGGPVSNSAGGGTIHLAAGDSTTSLTVNGLTLGNTSSYGSGNYTTLAYTLGASGIESLNVGTAGSATGTMTVNSGGAYITVVGTPITGTYTLASFGSSSTGLTNFSLSSSVAGLLINHVGVDTYTLVANATNLQLLVTGTAVPTTAYFKGATNAAWNDITNAPTTNWSTDLLGGMDAGNTPGPVTDVILNASTQTGTVVTTLGNSIVAAPTIINSLTVSNGTNTIADDTLHDTLTINAAAINGHTLGNAITVNGSNPFTIAAGLVLGNNGANQTWTNASSGLFTITGNVTGTAATNSTQTLTLANTSTGGTSFSGTLSDVSGGGNLALLVSNSGAGVTTLSGSNRFTGGVTIHSGTLQLGSTGALNATTPNALVFDAASTGKLQLYGNNVTVSSLNTNATIGSPIIESGSATAGTDVLTDNTTGSDTFAGILRNGSTRLLGLTKSGNGTLTLSGVNTYTGTTTLNAGTLTVGVAEIAGTSGPLGKSAAANPGSILFTGGALQYSSANQNDYSGRFSTTGSQAWNIDTNGQSVTFAGALQGTGSSLTKLGSGTLTLNGSPSYTGGTTVNNGRLVLSALGSYASATTTVAAGATLEWSVSSLVNLPNNNTAYTGAGVILKTGAGLLANANNAVTANMAAGGVLDVQTGDMNIGGSHGFQASNLGSFNVASGAFFHTSDGTLQVDALTGAGKINNAYNNSTPTLTIGVSGTTNNATYGVVNNTATFSGTIGYAETYNTVGVASMNVVKTGAGTQVLSGSNGYTGSTTVNQGILSVTGSLANTAVTVNGGTMLVSGTAASSAVTVNSGGTLRLDNRYALPTSTLSVNGSATSALTFGSGIGTFTLGGLTGSGALVLADTLGTAITLEVGANSSASSTDSGAISGAGRVTMVGTGTQTLSGALSYTGITTVQTGTLILGNFPEYGNGGTPVTGGSAVIAAGATLTVNYASGVTSALTSLTGGGTFNLVGSGTYDPLYAGGTTQTMAMSAGALFHVVSGTARLGYGGAAIWTNNYAGLTVDSGATFNLWDHLANANGIRFDALNGLGTITDTEGTTNTNTLWLGVANGSGTFGGTITNAAGDSISLVKAGTGTQILSGTNSYTGGTSINGGKLQVAATETPGTSGPLGIGGTISFGGGALQYSAANQADYSSRFSTVPGQLYSVDTNGQNATWAGALTSSGGTLTKSGTGILTLTGSNTYAGLTTVNAGELDLGTVGANGTTVVALNGGTLAIGDGKDAPGTYIVKLLANNQILNTAAVLINGTDGQLNLNGNNQTIASLSDTGTITLGGSTLSLGSGSLTVTGNTSTTYSGAITGSGSLIKGTGSGTLTLAATPASIALANATVNGGGLNFSNTTAGTITLATLVTAAGTTTNFAASINVAGGTLSAGTITVGGNGTFNTLDGATVSITGAGTLTTVNSGSLTVGGASTIATVSGGTLSLNGGTLGTVSGGTTTLAGNGTITTVSAGTMTLNGTAGITTVSGGTLNLNGLTASIGSLSSSGPITLGTTTALTITSGDFGGSIGGAGGTLVKGGSGNDLLVLSGSSGYSGGTSINAGTLQLGSGFATGSLAGSGAITDNAALVFNRNNTVTQGTDFGKIIGTGSLTQSGNGTLVLNTTNSYSGGTTISSGTLVFSTGALGSGNVTFTGGTLQYATGNNQDISGRILNSTNPIALDPNGGTITLGTLDISNVGGLTLAATAGTLVLASVNNYTGVTTVNGGVFSVSNLAGAAGTNDSLGVFSNNYANLVLNGGTLNYTGADVVTNRTFSLNLTGYPGAVTITSTGGALNFTPADASNDAVKTSSPTVLTLAGDGTAANTLGLKLSDGGTAAAVSLVKAGSGTWILAAGIDNTTVKYPGLWSGGTTISAGKLQLNASEALPSVTTFVQSGLSGSSISVGNVQVAGGATLDLNGHVNTLNSLSGSGTVTSSTGNGVLALGAVGTTFGGAFGGNITGTLGLVKFGNGTLTLTGSNSYSGGTTIQTGTVVLGSTTALPANKPLVLSPANNATDSANPTLDLGGNNLSVSALTGTATANAVVPAYDHIVVEGWNYKPGTSGVFRPTEASGGNVIALADASGNALMPSGLLVGQTLSAPGYLPSGTTITAISGLYVQLSNGFNRTGYTSLTFGSNNQATLTTGSFGAYSAAGSTPLIGNSGTTPSTLTVATSNTTYAGVIQDVLGSGTSNVALALTGSNSLTLTGSNTFTGGTTISTGSTLIVGDGATSGSRIAGNITNNSALTINTPDSWTYGGVIGSTGTLTKAGNGSLTLSGSNTYTGTTTITGGTLKVPGSLANNQADHIILGTSITAQTSFTSNTPAITRTFAQGASYATIGSSINTDRHTTASLLAGTIVQGNNDNSGNAVNLGMAWRTPTTGESFLFSDVVRLTGMTFSSTTHQTDDFVLAMSYDPNQAGAGSPLFLGTFVGNGWVSAVSQNIGAGEYAGRYAYSWQTFLDQHNQGSGATLALDLGAYGIDLNGHTVWAVLDHNSDFAVIPEPTSLGLLGLGALGLLARRGKRKA